MRTFCRKNRKSKRNRETPHDPRNGFFFNRTRTSGARDFFEQHSGRFFFEDLSSSLMIDPSENDSVLSKLSTAEKGESS